MSRITFVVLLTACGATSPTEAAPTEGAAPVVGSAARCLPVVGDCGCSYACGRSDGVAGNGNVLVRTGVDEEPVEAVVESWCQPQDECRDAFVRPLPCGGACVPTRAFDRCSFDGSECVAPAIDVLRGEAGVWLDAIAARQQMHMEEFGDYHPRSGSPIGWSPAELSEASVRWDVPEAWSEIPFRAGELTSLQFKLWAGAPGREAPVLGGPISEFWFVVHARGRAGGELVTFQRTSWNAEITVVDAQP